MSTESANASVAASTASPIMPLAKHSSNRRCKSSARTCGLRALSVLESGRQMRRRFAMGAEPRGTVARRRRMREYGGAVARGLGVMRQPRRLGSPLKSGQRRSMQRHAPVRWQAVLDGLAFDVVPEGHRVTLRAQHPRVQAPLELEQLTAAIDSSSQISLRGRPIATASSS